MIYDNYDIFFMILWLAFNGSYHLEHVNELFGRGCIAFFDLCGCSKFVRHFSNKSVT